MLKRIVANRKLERVETLEKRKAKQDITETGARDVGEGILFKDILRYPAQDMSLQELFLLCKNLDFISIPVCELANQLGILPNYFQILRRIKREILTLPENSGFSIEYKRKLFSRIRRIGKYAREFDWRYDINA